MIELRAQASRNRRVVGDTDEATVRSSHALGKKCVQRRHEHQEEPDGGSPTSERIIQPSRPSLGRRDQERSMEIRSLHSHAASDTDANIFAVV